MHVLNTTLPAHLSLFACLDFLRATHCLEYLAFCVPRLFACCTSSRGRRLLLVAEDVSFDWPAIAQHMRTHVQFHISCGLSLFAYLDFCELHMDAFGEHLLRLGSDVVRGERLRCGRLGPSPAT